MHSGFVQIDPSFDDVILSCLKFFFSLVKWKIVGGKNSVWFKGAQMMEVEWCFLRGIWTSARGGDLIIVEGMRFLLIAN